MNRFMVLAFVMAIVTICGRSFAYVVPEEKSETEYLYVIGPKGNPKKGAEDHKQELNIDVPADAQGEIMISIYDPDTGGDIDAKRSRTNPWDTTTEAIIYGKEGKELEKIQFGESGYDEEFYRFRSFTKTEGKDLGGFFRFTLDITAIEGDDANLFKVKVLPNSVKVSSTNITYRLLPKEGAKMYFYPLIPEGTDKIIVENYDLDVDGGSSVLLDPLNNKEYDINDSDSGEWRKTEITLLSTNERFVDYVVTKATQIDAHAGLRILDGNGNALPIYFSKEETPVSASNCNEFTFDATSSFDPDNQALTFLWDFGDGIKSDKAVVKHKYENGGDYNVILSVTDNSGLECDTAVTSQSIYVNTPPEAVLASPEIACIGQEIVFDASATTDDTPDKLSYKWNFGDGTRAEGQQVTKVFEKGGTYNVNLVVKDNSGTTCDTDRAGQTITINTPPVADAGEDVDLCLKHDQEYSVRFEGSGSKDADNNSLTYKWDFGDGSGETGVDVTHVYQKRGEYVATLSVDDESGSVCNSDTDSVNVRINKEPVANAGNDSIVCLGTEVLFDGSATIGEDGEDLTYDWDFGDGTIGSGVQVAHTYATGGTYKAGLTVNDGQFTKCSLSSDSVTVTVNTQPSVALNGHDIACTGDTISFDASATNDLDGDNLTYKWDFGDGSTEQNGPKVTHVYNKGGSYLVTLEVDDNKGTECSLDSADVLVKINTPPVADAGPNLVCCLDKVTDFNGASSHDADGDTLSYVWDFGDGTSGEGVNVSHAYSSPGEYTVTLTVNDNSATRCDTATDSFTAVVNAKPTPVIKIR